MKKVRNGLVQPLRVHGQFAVHAEKETIQHCTTNTLGIDTNL